MSTASRRLGTYELRNLLGRGSTGEIWQGYDYAARGDIAIKLLHHDLLQNDPNFLTMFLQIWQPLLALHHPNIVQVREANISPPSESGGMTPYIVMDYIDGRATLADSIQQTSHAGRFPPVTEIVSLFTSLGYALDYAHQQGIVHGDIKPTNILFARHDPAHLAIAEPLLTDFGIANLPGNKAHLSPYYLAPEQAKGNMALPSSDIYALGVLLYEICTGTLPFHGESHAAILMHQVNTLPTPPTLINPHIPPELSEVILRAMAKKPDSRFATASRLASAVAEACLIVYAAPVTLNTQRVPVEQRPYDPTQASLSAAAPQVSTILGVSEPLPILSTPHSVMPPGSAPARTSGYFQAVPNLGTPLISTSGPTTQRFPVSQAQTTGKQTTPPPPVPPATPSMVPPPHMSTQWKPRSSTLLSPLVMMIFVLFLLLIVVGSLGASLLLHTTNNQAAPVGSVVGHAFFQDDALGHDDLLRIELHGIPAPPAGKRYVAWFQNAAGGAVPLGPLSTQNGNALFLYLGDANHTNLLSVVRGVFVTLENDGSAPPQTPSRNATVYQAVFVAPALPYIEHILYQLPNFSGHTSLIAGLFETIKSMNDKAGSIVDSLQGTHDYTLAQRQSIRIIELIDGSRYARDSGDLPLALHTLLATPVGLISSPTQIGYIDALAEQIHQVLQVAGNNIELRQHAQNISNALADLRNWIQQLRTYDLQILKAANLRNAAMLNVALQLQQIAADAYTGRTIPPNQGPLPLLGSAGAYQAYVECQYMATLDIQKVA